jgi:hypothetical protein
MAGRVPSEMSTPWCLADELRTEGASSTWLKVYLMRLKLLSHPSTKSAPQHQLPLSLFLHPSQLQNHPPHYPPLGSPLALGPWPSPDKPLVRDTSKVCQRCVHAAKTSICLAWMQLSWISASPAGLLRYSTVLWAMGCLEKHDLVQYDANASSPGCSHSRLHPVQVLQKRPFRNMSTA